MNSQMKRYAGQGLGGPQVQELLSPWTWEAPLSWDVSVFEADALCSADYWAFYGDLITWA